jgi:hypothetical protein
MFALSSTGVERRYAPAEAAVVIGKVAFEFSTKTPLWAVFIRRGAGNAYLDISMSLPKWRAGI